MVAPIRYHGGKHRLAPKIVSLFPSHTAYVEPFGGGAACLLRKSVSQLEVYNDLDGEMVNLFRVLRERGDDLARVVALTPFARDEHILAHEPSDCELERARRTVVRSHFGHGSNGIHRKTGFRAAGLRSGTLPVHTWARVPESLCVVAERLRCVVIENRDALAVMSAHDGANTLHYVDPPYVMETRDAGRNYRFEMTDADHVGLVAFLRTLSGFVVLSGYENPIYTDGLRDWRRVELRARADRAGERLEILWMNFDPVRGLFAWQGGDA